MLLLVGGLLRPGAAHANVVCGLNGASPGVSLGSASSGQGTIGYTCTNYSNSAVTFTICAGIGTPSYPGSPAQPQMLGGGSTLAFNVYTNASITQVWTTSNPVSAPVSIAGGIGTSVSGLLTFYGAINVNQTPPAGTYNASFYNTVLGFLTGNTCLATPPGGNFSGLDFTLSAQATVVSACVVNANPTLNLGTVSAGTANISGSNTIQVNCPTGTTYYIGMSPSNNSTAGAGVMKGTNGNADSVPYQLRSGSITGATWGNTATATSVGNGVAGTGSGATQSFTVYATASNTDVTPDSYSDTVTVIVNY